jgi:hypothetical protein
MNIVKNKNAATKNININIWDDYYDDGYVPDGERLETFIYVEDTEFSHEDRKKFLLYLKEKIDSYKLPIETKMAIYDTKIEYPNLNFEELQMQHWKRHEIRIYDMTHKIRHELIKKLRKENLKIDNKNFNIYSES